MIKTSSFVKDCAVISQHTLVEVLFNQNTKQHSLNALIKLNAGDKIADFTAGEILTAPSYLTVQVGINRHITLNPAFLQYVNHSCDPNIFFDTAKMEVVCLKPIEAGEELRFFYPSTEWEMSQPFVCNCGAANCLKLINGAAHLSDDILAQYRLSDFIRRQITHRL